MSNSNKLLKNTVIYTVGNLGSRILSFLLVPLYSFFLTKSDLGYYDLILTTVSLMVPFVTLQISDASYRWLLEANKEEKLQEAAISNGLFCILINTVIFAIIYIPFSYFFRFSYTYYFIILLFLSSLFPFLQQVVRGLGNNKLFSFIGIINTFFLLIFNVFFLFVLKKRLEGLLLSIILSYSISTLLLFRLAKMLPFINFKLVNRKDLKEMLNYSWPLIPNTVSWWMINEVNRFIILLNIGPDANGIFALSNRFPSILLILNSIFMLSWQDHAITNHKDENKNVFYSKIFNIYMILELTLVIFLTVVSKYLVKYFVGPKFFDSWRYMPILYLSVAFSAFASFLGASYLGIKKTKGIFTTTIIGSVINIAISYAFIKQIGLYAPALGTLFGFITIWIIRLRDTKEFFTLSVNWPIMLILLAILAICLRIVFFNNYYWDLLAGFVAIFAVLIFNKKLIIFLTRSLKKGLKKTS